MKSLAPLKSDPLSKAYGQSSLNTLNKGLHTYLGWAIAWRAELSAAEVLIPRLNEVSGWGSSCLGVGAEPSVRGLGVQGLSE